MSEKNLDEEACPNNNKIKKLGLTNSIKLSEDEEDKQIEVSLKRNVKVIDNSMNRAKSTTIFSKKKSKKEEYTETTEIVLPKDKSIQTKLSSQ